MNVVNSCGERSAQRCSTNDENRSERGDGPPARFELRDRYSLHEVGRNQFLV